MQFPIFINYKENIFCLTSDMILIPLSLIFLIKNFTFVFFDLATNYFLYLFLFAYVRKSLFTLSFSRNYVNHFYIILFHCFIYDSISKWSSVNRTILFDLQLQTHIYLFDVLFELLNKFCF